MKNIIGILIVLSSVFSMKAQLITFPFKSNNQQIIEEAIKESLYEVYQSYILIDTVSNQKLGRNGKDYFNKIIYLGILTEKGILTPININSPWEDDDCFLKYKGKYKPEISKTEFRKKNESTELQDSIHEILAPYKNIIGTNLMGRGIPVDTVSGEKDGWIVWITRDEIGNRNFSSFKKKVNITTDSKQVIIEKPEEINNIEGVYYFVSSITAPGQITFSLSAYGEEKEGIWSLIFPFIKDKENILTPLNTQTNKKTAKGKNE